MILSKFASMKVEVTSSWTHPESGKILPIGTKLDIDARFFNPSFLKEVKRSKKK